jgi:preprotein translocase subunit SecB
MADTPQAGGPPPGAATFSIEKIYVKDLSLENPGAPMSFRQQEAPGIEIGLRTSGDQIEPNVFESVLTVTLTAKAGERTVFLVEAAQAGIFTIKGVPADQLQGILAVHCPTVLFPYVRETIADAVARAGFPPVHLAPINFEALYAQQVGQGVPAAAAAN